MQRTIATLIACALFGLPNAAHSEVTLLAKAIIPPSSTDLSGLTDTLPGNIPHNRLGALGSGIAFTGRDDTYIMLPDRGPFDGAAEYRCRFHVVQIVAGKDNKAEIKLVKTVMLTDEQGRPLVGSSAAIDPKDNANSTRFDPEAVRIARDGTLYITDEYGPSVAAFSPEGKRIRRFDIPKRYLIEHPDAVAQNEFPPANTSGRSPNGGFEGLALTPEGTTLVTLTQFPLLQDATIKVKENGEKEARGATLRMLVLSVEDDPAQEFAYRLSSDSMGVNEILSISKTHYLVLERDGKGGADAEHKIIQLVNTEGATDVSKIDSLAERQLPLGVKPVTLTRFVDLLDPKFGLKGKDFPKKIEGMCFGPKLPDGRGTLVVTSDNDFDDEAPTHVWIFAFDGQDLPAVKKSVPQTSK